MLLIIGFWVLKSLLISTMLYRLSLSKTPQRKLVRWSFNFSNTEEVPLVCIQIPVFNEPKHILGILESALKIEWPKSRLEYQILDDSNDEETTKLIQQFIRRKENSEDSVQINHIHRSNREGFKAGALNHGLKKSGADYFAIFDVDFRPASDFLYEMMPLFESKNSKVAAVQAAWSYYNQNKNYLTKIQEILLNIHFHIEHFGRFHRKLAFNFNGTAGIWSKKALQELNGWSSNSVCEDLLLSYKAQMKGFKLVFADHYRCSSELPETFHAFLIQQRRWALGSGQVLRLLGKKIVKHQQWSLYQKLDVLFNLFGYAISTIAGLMIICLPFWILYYANFMAQSPNINLSAVVDLSVWVIFSVVYFLLFASKRAQPNTASIPKRLYRACVLFLCFPLLVTQIAMFYWRGLFASTKKHKKWLVFHRTPKGRKGSVFKRSDMMVSSFVAMIFVVSSALALSQKLYFIAGVLMFNIALILYVLFKEYLNIDFVKTTKQTENLTA